ncbi:site-specific DNA-methyltransferase [Limnohabitans sp.]|uniref:site-specific DNA-methyltransferase n=1 Tax=Limnohabitans sp. TaxID=1907725 RepID=UPI0025BAA812|nr:site-specific DNA-methyltransferase [Limnohabitans sp.]
MPTLDWLDRQAAFSVANKTATHVLRPHTAGPNANGVFGDATSARDNLLIQGDNLQALKALLPFYRGQVKCIFIDPPYNTKSAFEHYDDNLEHSQWLSMMLPRLQVLRDLLREDGSIWVTIDDNEGHYLKVMMDEVFGRKRFIATIVWQSRYSRSSDTAISISHNFIHCYAQNPDNWKLTRNRLQRTSAQEKQFSNPDNDPRGPWRAIPWDAPNIRANLSYPIITAKGSVRHPPPGRCWSRTEPQWLDMVSNGKAYFGKNGDGAPSFKQYLDDAPPIVPNTWWSHDEAGHTDESKKEIQALFGTDSTFGTPKPERLLQRIIHIATNPGDLVLDSFLGSGTTAAVAHKMGRRWIGIEMGEHATTHCTPRLQKVIDGEQGGISAAVGWQGGGGFQLLQLGAPLFDEQGDIHPEVRFADLAAFIWMRETGTALPAQAASGPLPLLGVHEGTAYYLLFNGILGDRRPASGNVLTTAVLHALNDLCGHDGPKVIYGEACRLGDARLKAEGISFKQLPHAVPR